MNREALKARLAIEEGERLAAYLDTEGILTVGIGHNCAAKPVAGVTKVGDRITTEMEQIIFDADVDEACVHLDHYLPWWRKLDDPRQNVLVDLCFNMGIGTLLTFKNTLAAVESGNFDAAAAGLQASKWHKQVGNRAVFLENVMKTGIYA